MPWCPECDRFLSPATVTPEGTCPRCGRVVDPGRARAPGPEAPGTAEPAEALRNDAGSGDAEPEGDGDHDGLPPVPWHLKLMVGAVAVYLGWRALQGIEWVVHQF